MSHRVATSAPFQRACLFLVFSASVACGTALYHHAIKVSTLNGSETQVGVFDHQQGYSRDWAHRALGPASPSTAYSATLTSTAAVSLGSVHQAHPFDIAIAIPEVTDEGYFLLTVDTSMQHETRPARFCRYDEYVPAPNAAAIPLVVTTAPSKDGWRVEMSIDMAAARQAVR